MHLELGDKVPVFYYDFPNGVVEKNCPITNITAIPHTAQVRSRGERELNGRKPAQSISLQADNGRDVSRFFTNSGKMQKPIQRVNVDFTAAMLEELEAAAKELNISRQGLIKAMLRQPLDHRQTARSPAATSGWFKFHFAQNNGCYSKITVLFP
jgi:hypothetical protein